MVTELFGKGFYLLRLLTDNAFHGERQTDDNPPDLVLSNDSDNNLNVVWLISAVDDGERASQNTLGVTEGYSNPLIANIKP